jgi:protein-disulfide isomerase
MLSLNYDSVVDYDVAVLTQPVTRRDHILGAMNAPLTLVEYGDYQCPYCAQAHPVVEQLRQALGQRLRTVYRHFPLTQVHPKALPAAKAAEAAANQGKFERMHDMNLSESGVSEPTGFDGMGVRTGPGHGSV